MYVYINLCICSSTSWVILNGFIRKGIFFTNSWAAGAMPSSWAAPRHPRHRRASTRPALEGFGHPPGGKSDQTAGRIRHLYLMFLL